MRIMDDLKAIVATLQEKMKVCENRIKNLENNAAENNNAVQNLQIMMANLSNKLDNTSKVADKLLAKLEKMEEEPKEFNNRMKQQVVNVLISFSIGTFAAFLVGMFVYYIKIR